MICQEREVLFLRHKPPHPDSPSPGNSVGLYLIFGAVNSLISCLQVRSAVNPPPAFSRGRGTTARRAVLVLVFVLESRWSQPLHTIILQNSMLGSAERSEKRAFPSEHADELAAWQDLSSVVRLTPDYGGQVGELSRVAWRRREDNKPPLRPQLRQKVGA